MTWRPIYADQGDFPTVEDQPAPSALIAQLADNYYWCHKHVHTGDIRYHRYTGGFVPGEDLADLDLADLKGEYGWVADPITGTIARDYDPHTIGCYEIVEFRLRDLVASDSPLLGIPDINTEPRGTLFTLWVRPGTPQMTVGGRTFTPPPEGGVVYVFAENEEILNDSSFSCSEDPEGTVNITGVYDGVALISPTPMHEVAAQGDIYTMCGGRYGVMDAVMRITRVDGAYSWHRVLYTSPISTEDLSSNDWVETGTLFTIHPPLLTAPDVPPEYYYPSVEWTPLGELPEEILQASPGVASVDIFRRSQFQTLSFGAINMPDGYIIRE